MPITACIELGDASMDIRITVDEESFECRNSAGFIRCLKDLTVKPESKFYLIGLHRVKALNTKALGAFLIAREFAMERDCNISVVNCRSAVMNVLHRANFQQIFPIEEIEISG